MKQKIFIALLTAMFMIAVSITAQAQNVCSKRTGEQMKIHIRNAVVLSAEATVK
jgi:hypothetical protein